VSPELYQLRKDAQRLLGVQQGHLATVARMTDEVAALRTEADLLTHVHAALDTLLGLLSKEATGQVEALVSYGLTAVFDDLRLQFTLPFEVKRGLPWLEPTLTEGQVTAPVLDAFGGGPANLIAFLLRLLVCRRLGLAPVLLLDEPFNFVSEKYIPATAALLRELAERLGFTIILVTHQPAFLSEATRAYQVEDTPAGRTFREVRDP
jgi:hypothetical protein